MRYSFHPRELNRWKARITERLVECYVNDVLVSKLKKEGWDDVLYTSHAWFAYPNEKIEFFKNLEIRLFIANRLFPTKEFLEGFKKLTRLLENVPDGFLIKLKKTGKTKSLKEALQESGLSYHSWSFGGYRFDRMEHDENELLPVVNGEIEVIEIKSGKSVLPPSQKRSYRNILQEGYVLRFFHVNIISFKNNDFEIEEKIIRNPNELKTFPINKKELECEKL